jgi:2'-5' RNA ligase
MNLNTSLVLVPTQEQENQIRKTIDTFAEKYHSYSFIPHITTYYLGMTSKLAEINNFIDVALHDVHQFDLELDDISYSDMFTKTLFANYKISSSLTALYNKFHCQHKGINDYHLAPHLSLIYKNNMKNEDKEKEIIGLSLPKKLIIDRLYVITRENGGIKEEQDVLQWKVAHQISFK